ncbi:MAG: cell division protein FtsZ [Deltaproteobacteria bacterium]|nr:cell division protein FtsZ [Deltaproteobacteria bacterium]
MSFQFDSTGQHGAVIKVIGAGGAGCNAVNTMIGAQLEGVEFMVANTDQQALDNNRAPYKLQIGEALTKGLGAGANPEIGCNAAREDSDKIKQSLDGSDMVFVAAGMGGGTGTGAAPVIAEIARSVGALTVGVVTTPFRFEGNMRSRIAAQGLKELEGHVDSLIVIPNEKLFAIGDKKMTLLDGFKMADEVLLHAIKSISDLINVPGLINLDFADVKTIMSDMGKAFMGIGIHSGENRAAEAARKALANPLLEDVTIKGAKGMLINITGNSSLSFMDLEEATGFIKEEADEDANIIFGAAIDDRVEENFQITVIATGFSNEKRNAKDVEVRPQARKQAVERPHDPPTVDDLPPIEMEKVRQDSRVVNKIGTIISEFGDEGEFDTPTFVRQQQQKTVQ